MRVVPPAGCAQTWAVLADGLGIAQGEISGSFEVVVKDVLGTGLLTLSTAGPLVLSVGIMGLLSITVLSEGRKFPF